MTKKEGKNYLWKILQTLEENPEGITKKDLGNFLGLNSKNLKTIMKKAKKFLRVDGLSDYTGKKLFILSKKGRKRLVKHKAKNQATPSTDEE